MITPFQIWLLIDDNPLDNYINSLLIQKNNFASEVIALESSEEALFELQVGTIKPDVIFLDINMPVLNGFEFLAKYAKLDITNAHCITPGILQTPVPPILSRRTA